jgi:cysteinyl-tRNA synthetase
MSKSLGNFLTIKDALELYSPEAIRAFVLSAHYSSPLDYSRDAMVAAEQGVRRLKNTLRAIRARLNRTMPEGTADLSFMADLEPYREAFTRAMDDNLGTPQAIATLHDLARQVNQWMDEGRPLSRGTLFAIDGLFNELGGDVLGIIPADLTPQGVDGELLDGLVQIVLEIRDHYRYVKDWEQADSLRGKLEDIGIVVEDRPEGSTWRLE